MDILHERCPELNHLEDLLQYSSPLVQHRCLCQVEHLGEPYPVYGITLGNPSPNVPVVAFIAGVHGVERIGTQVVLAFLESLIQRLQWDATLTDSLSMMRLLFVPLVNPIGMTHNTRSNGNDVDLMRNAPLTAQQRPAFLVGGQRLSRHLPWYRGKVGQGMESEAQALCNLIRDEVNKSPFTLVLDVHSGFGFTDRIWFPYAHSLAAVPHVGEIFRLRQLLQNTYPHLDYLFEPQSHHYTTHGDLWDYLYMEACAEQRLLVPLTLELGSWRWIKKNPRQLFSALGLFNPMVPHRVQRVLRRHVTLMEFLIRATRSYEDWLPSDNDLVNLRRAAMRLWYEPAPH